MSNGKAYSWRRIAVEGAVIVVSILLAFAIDAWWEDRGAHAAELEQLVRVSQELEVNSGRLRRKLVTIEYSIEGTEELISWMGPEPVDVPPQTFHRHWNKFFSIGMYSVLRSASQEYLATGTAGSLRHVEIRDALSAWHTDADDLEEQYGLLRVAHKRINDYTEDLVPTFHDIIGTGVVNQDLVSKFPYDQRSLLSDPYFESRLATYLIRLEFVSGQANDLLQDQAELVALINAVTSR
jgi:hypothetical protein